MDGSGQNGRRPRRQDSAVSTTSSGDRTVRASSNRGRRRSSGSQPRTGPPTPRKGIFARITGSSAKHSSSDSDVEDDDDGAMDGQEGASSVHDRVSSPNGVEGRTWEMDDKEAGPSDYWRRSRSPSPVHVMSFPPSGWKMGSSGMWDGHAEDGPSDEWRPNTPPPGTDHFPFTPPYPSKTAGLEDTDSPGISTPNEIDDEAQFAKRLKDVFVQPSPTKARSTENGDGSPMSSRPRSLRNGYNSEFQDIVGSPAGRVGDEEFGTLEFPQKDDMSDRSPSISSSSYRNADQLGSNLSPMRLKRQSTTPYVHPSISRLRSHMRSSSSNSQVSLSGRPAHLLHNRIPSHFSQISLARSDSTSNMSSVLNPPPASVPAPKSEDPAFTFHPMRQLSAHLFSKRSGGRAAKQAEESPQIALGKPTVMAVKGVIAVGTDNGYVTVYSFNQELRCILGTQATTAASGAVTCVTISPDETYVGVGHATGNIYLYDLASPNKPSRTSLALTLKQVMSGRKEGHLQGSKILHIGFVAARHTAIISGDEHGRAFWLSLGRVMGVDSNDVVRILGSYPERETPTARPASPSSTQSGSLRGSQRSKRATTLLASGPLPLGTEPHKSDQFQLSALLTPSKLVIVGMKPTAKTWYRKMRDSTGGASGGYTGCAAWLRSGELAPQSDPVLAYAWGQSVRFLRVKTSSTAGDDSPVAAKDDKPQFVDGNKFEAPNPVKALQWFDSDHVVLVTTAEIILLDVRNMRPVENTALATHMLTPNDSFADFATKSGLADIATTALYGSIQVHRNKLFILSRSNVQVGTLQHWNDRILACVHRGDFLEAIQVALSYYDNRANGNTIDLPSDETERKALVGARVRELLKASLDWAFSEDRMRDDTHYSSDGRGVDLTALFEGLAKSCVEACLTMSDLDYLFDEAYENYSNVGIQNIFLQVLEPYIFDQRIRNVPPTIIQALIAMHENKAELDLAEAVIWNVEPMWLDINQAVTLCEKYGLWDALIHVYTQAMKDYVAPLVKLLNLVREIQEHRKHRDYGVGASGEVDMEANAPNAYKIFAYVEHILSGIPYPAGGSLPPTEAEDAKAAVYSFIFAGRPMIWPQGSDGRVIFPEDGERPYPYLDILLQFDTEAFLHSMDIAFEDSYLNDSRSVVNRQSIINIMLDIMDPEVYHSTEVTLLHIFVARNLPKYPQFLFIPPSTLHRILVSLAQDPDQSSREDRQLAAEYLLSAYKPHDLDVMLQLFETAGFYRILRSSFRQEQRWEPLISTLIKDPELDMEVFAEIEEIIKQTSKSAKSELPDEVKRGIVDALPHLFDLSVQQTAILIDRSASTLHKEAIDLLDGSDHKQMAYLRCLLDPSSDDSDERDGLASSAPPSKKLDNIARHKYVSLLHRHESASVIGFLDKQGPDAFDLPLLTQQMEDSRCFEGQLWCLDRQGLLKETFETTGDLLRSQGVDLAQAMVNKDEGTLHLVLENLQSISHMAMRLCREHSSEKREGLEDIWYGVLHEMLELSHSTNTLSSKDDTAGSSVRETLRAILQETLSALVASSSSSLSFPRLFKRLVDSSSTANKGGSKKGRAYSEFRSILTGMLDSYRSEGDMLAMTTKLVEADLFASVEKMTRKRQQGWRPAEIACAQCGETLVGNEATGTILVIGSGRLVHQSCAEGSEAAGEAKGAQV